MQGMWQPSLNISTVLTSIGLLLSEPNPDDGLMHEAVSDSCLWEKLFKHRYILHLDIYPMFCRAETTNITDKLLIAMQNP